MPLLLLKNLPRYECLRENAREFPELDPSACDVFLHLLRASDEVFGVVERNLTSHSISQGRFGVLMILWHRTQLPSSSCTAEGGSQGSSGPLTPAELADAAGVTRATMTGLIDTLERDGFVLRVPDPEDRRMMSVRLTEKAEIYLRNLMPSHYQLMSQLMAPLSETERKTMVRLLTKVLHRAGELSALPTPAIVPVAHAS